ncbi:MAG: amidohydrolase family protein, partial [Gemmatimonadota bacterium]
NRRRSRLGWNQPRTMDGDMKMLVLACAMLGLVGAGPARPPQQPRGEFAFVDVNVVPMDRDRVLEHQTVLVRAGRIVAVGPTASVKVPGSATRIDGAGKYLIPGLGEMHAHIDPRPDQTALNDRILSLFALTGVTTVRGMLGAPQHLPLRDKANRGEILSPRIYTTGPSLNGTSVPTVAAAIKAVTEQKAAGYDLMKIHPGIKREVFDSLAATAQRLHIRFAGHVPLDVGVRRAIAARYWSIDHVDGFLEGLAGMGPFTLEEDGFFGSGLVDKADFSKLPALAQAAKANGVWIVPTETLMESLGSDLTAEQLMAWPEMKYWPTEGLDTWAKQTVSMRSQLVPAVRAKFVAARRRLIKGLYDADVKFILGSDAPQVWNVPGFSARRELELLVAAGLTPYQALEIGTKNVADFFGTLKDGGTIEAGKRADLVLLDRNPLTDIKAVWDQSGVMLAGRWLDRAEIDQKLGALATQ